MNDLYLAVAIFELLVISFLAGRLEEKSDAWRRQKRRLERELSKQK